MNEPKYKIGDEVLFLYDNSVRKGSVGKIEITAYSKRYYLSGILFDCWVEILEHFLFPTIDALLDSLRKQYEELTHKGNNK
jgi:hypothetical protein